MSNPFRQLSSSQPILYDDLKSARSAILSGSARNRHASARGMASSSPGGSLDSTVMHDAVPLQEMKPLNDIPLPPRPAKVSNTRRIEIEPAYAQMGNAYSNEQRSYQPHKSSSNAHTSGNSVTNKIKKAFPINPSLVTKDNKNSEKGYAMSEDGNSNYNQEPRVGGSMQSSKGHHTGTNQREGSTVGNIYRLYAPSDREEGDLNGYRALSPVGSLAERLASPTTPPPKFPLPSLPGLDELLSDNTSTPVVNSSGVFSEAGDSTVPSLPKFSPKNPFRSRSQNGGCRPSSSYADDGHCIYDDRPESSQTRERMPLEREVSEALRRASGFSFYSMGSISSSILEPGPQCIAPVYDQAPGPLYPRQERLEGILAADPEVGTEESTFYDPNALVSNQTVHQHHSIRVPIVHNRSSLDPSHIPRTHHLAPILGRRSDLQDAFLLSPLTRDSVDQIDTRQTSPEDDWETVGESGFAPDGRRSREHTVGMFGSYGNYGADDINRAGSSIANTSDAGSLSIYIPRIEQFNSSTDRIAQHPAKIAYSGDYRLRELKKTNMPVLLPSYREHKVNGYLANSSRVIPPNPAQWFGSSPKPIKQPHRHPFRSTPPQVSPSHPSMPKSNRKKANHFPRLSRTLRDDNLATSSDSHPSSWQDLVTFASGHVPAVNENGTRLEGFGKKNLKDASLGTLVAEESAHVDKNTEDPGSGRPLHQRLVRRPLVRGLPGAFYQGLRSEGKRRVTGPHQESQPARHPSQHGTKDYPTNELRPLSLSNQLNHSAAPKRSPSQGSNDYFYRPSMTLPQRQTWRDLYTSDQLIEIEKATEQSLFDRYRTEHWLQGSVQESTMEDMVPRKFFEAPTLCPAPRNAVQGSLPSTKDSISIAVLFVCTFFPPLLGLYLAGYLDGIMVWATSGECSTFTRQGRKGALALLFCWLVAGVFALVIFVTWWFTLRKHH